MAKQSTLSEGPSLARPPEPLKAPPLTTEPLKDPPQRRAPDPPPAPALSGPGEDYRVMVRHCPWQHHKTLVVRAASPEGAWEAYQARLREILAAEGKQGAKAWDLYWRWLANQPQGVPPDVQVLPEAAYQARREEIRSRRPVAAGAE